MTDPKTPTNSLKQRADSYANLISGLGGGQDKSSYSTFLSDRILGHTELGLLYEQDAIAARIVDRVVDDATRVGFTLEDQNKSFDFASVKSELEDLDAINQIGDAWRWSRLYGGSICVMAVNDGKPYNEPLDLANATKLNALTVVDSTNVMPQGYSPGLGSRGFANPELYEVLVPFGSEKIRQIHRSRVIRFDGIKVPVNRMMLNNGWGPSVLQRTWREIKRLGTAMGYAENVLHELSVMVLGITDLRDMLCGGDGNQDQVKQMLDTLKWGIDNLHILAIDKEDSFTEIKRGVEGVSNLLDKFVDGLVRGTDYPRLILLGEAPGGLGSAGGAQSEVRGYYDHVSAEQEQKLTPALNRVLSVLFAIRSKSGETVPTEWTIKYDSLTQMAPEQQAQTDFLTAQTMQLLITNGVLSPDEARQKLIDAGYISPLAVQADDPLALT